MDILIIAGIVLIIVFVVLILKKRGNKKINYKDRIKLESILENEEFIKKDGDSATKNPASDSTNVLQPTVDIQDDTIIKVTDKSIKYYNKGVALVKGEKYEESIPYLNEAIRLNSSEATTYYYRGIAKSKLNLFKDAIDDFTDAMLRQIKDVDAFFQRGYARLKIEDNENALLDFTHYISIEKNNPEAFYQKGVLEYEKENYQSAIDDFSNAIILSPNHESAYFKRGLARQITGDISGCCKDLKIAFEKGNLEAYHYIKKFCDK
ncbi:MAG: tetratricopeptide repeat protein [Bacteroidetes bacterium]|nr:tetratricopeptide repeat protein [Bacteroidota bacterium]